MMEFSDISNTTHESNRECFLRINKKSSKSNNEYGEAFIKSLTQLGNDLNASNLLYLSLRISIEYLTHCTFQSQPFQIT